MLAEVLKTLPENRPGHAQIVTHVNDPVIDRFIVLDVEWSGNQCDQRAVLKVHQETGVEANHDQRLGRRVSIAILPVGIIAAYGFRQTIGRTIQVNRSDLAGTGCQDGCVSSF